MGFLEEIARRKQQQQFAVQKAAEEIKQGTEGNAKGFIRDGVVIADLLWQLYKAGYKGYFEDVSKISRLNLKTCFLYRLSKTCVRQFR